MRSPNFCELAGYAVLNNFSAVTTGAALVALPTVKNMLVVPA